MCKIFKKFTEGNARKFTVNFAFFGYADVIKCQENLTISCERAQITTAHIISVRGHKTIESHLNPSLNNWTLLSRTDTDKLINPFTPIDSYGDI